MPQKLITLDAVVVAAAGTAVPISATVIRSGSVIIEAHPDNTGDMYVGDSNVDATNGITLQPGQSVEISGNHLRNGDDEIILSDIYVDAATNGDEVRVSYLGRR